LKILWEPLKAEIKTRIPLHNFRMWIDPLVQKEGAGNTLVLSCPNNFSKKRVMNYFGPLIVSEIKKAYGAGDANLSLRFPDNAKGRNSKQSRIFSSLFQI